MGAPLNKNSRMECPRHGIRPPTFICQHLRTGHGIGFNEPYGPPDLDFPFQSAWCNACDRVMAREGGWNDVSEGYAGVTAICEGCFEEIRTRNQPPGNEGA